LRLFSRVLGNASFRPVMSKRSYGASDEV
jgi:hypothetical protein